MPREKLLKKYDGDETFASGKTIYDVDVVIESLKRLHVWEWFNPFKLVETAFIVFAELSD